ncbi:MAG: hypothetical protein QOG92_51, partial [Verrucomicrobiota bacterium]|nr:hypothetical protein [Verrucomicrobiota bacterium]
MRSGGPPKGALDYPTSGQENETAFCFLKPDHFHTDRIRGGFFSGVALIG